MSETTGEARLTDEGFWERYWTSLQIPSRINPHLSFERCLSRALAERVPNGHGKRLLEIGAAPGRWLIFLHETLGYEVDGIEYVPSACRKTEENLALCGTPGRVFAQDVFNNDLPRHSYDAVLSLGFIEHFTDVDPVIAAHVALLRPGGALILGVPNFRGLHGIAERLTDPEMLAAHNRDIMRVSFMKGLAGRFELTPDWIGYLGGVEPSLITVAEDADAGGPSFAAWLRRKRTGLLRRVLVLLHRIRNRAAFLDRWNAPFFSSYLLAIYRYHPQGEEGEEGQGVEGALNDNAAAKENGK